MNAVNRNIIKVSIKLRKSGACLEQAKNKNQALEGFDTDPSTECISSQADGFIPSIFV